MKLLLVYPYTALGGIETLILRMVKFLTTQGHLVDVLLMREGDAQMTAELRQCSQVYVGWKFFQTDKQFKRLGEEYYQYIYTFNTYSLVYALFIQKTYFKLAKLSFGVYHPKEYCWAKGQGIFLSNFITEVVRFFPDKNIFFMNQGAKNAHIEFLQRNFSESPIVVLPVDVEKLKDIERNPNKTKIVSIGRIVNFKSYNFLMVDVVKELNQQGYDFTCHIYGHGDQTDELQRYINNRDMQQHVYLHGAVPYQDFPSVLKDAFLFVGMGTALVEAAACGVPCLGSIDSDKNAETYGFFSQTDDFDLGEVDVKKTRYKFVDKIIELYKLSDEEYLQLASACKQRAQDFSTDKVMYLFLNALEASEKVLPNFSNHKVFFALADVIFWYFLKKLGFSSPLTLRMGQE